MPKALSLDLRQRALALASEGVRTLQIARQLRVSPAWVRRQKQRRREGQPLGPGVAPGRAPRFDAASRATLIGWVDREPDATLAQLQAHCRDDLGLRVSIGTTLEHAARRAAHAQKKSQHASEQLRPDVASAREIFLSQTLAGIPLDQVVVIDETYATTTFTRLRGRALRGRRLVARVPHGHWTLLTILAAITVNGVLAAASVAAAADADVFQTFIDHALVPRLRPGMVVVMDNLAVHKVASVAASIAAAGCRIVYLPPYSPDLSPIENIFAKLKQSLRTHAARDVPHLHRAIGDALATITPGDCLGCFRHCGYTQHLS